MEAIAEVAAMLARKQSHLIATTRLSHGGYLESNYRISFLNYQAEKKCRFKLYL